MAIKDILADVLPIIENNAPSIATAIMSPAVGIPEMALSILANAFKTPTNPQYIKDAIKDHPDALDSLKAAEQDHAFNIIKVLGLKQPSKLEINVKIDWENQMISSD